MKCGMGEVKIAELKGQNRVVIKRVNMHADSGYKHFFYEVSSCIMSLLFWISL